MRGCAILTDRPDTLHRDDRGRLHHETGPALRYRDGWAIYSMHGVCVPERVIMDPSSLTLDEIREEQNAEVKRIMREQYGEGRYLADIGAAVVDTDTIGVGQHHDGQIMRALIQDDEGRRFLVGTDGSTGRTYHMQVDEDAATCVAAHESIMPPGVSEAGCVGSS